MAKQSFILSSLIAIGALTSTPLHAEDSFSDSYEARPGLHFADLEFAMPRNPLLRSTELAWKARQTPQSVLTDARQAVRAVVPVGMTASDASDVLRKAGAKCKVEQAQALVCHYAAVETRDEWVDAIDWTVRVALVEGRVADLSLAREWWRHG